MTSKTDKLAALGGEPIYCEAWPAWPHWDEKEEQVLAEVVKSGQWGICPEPNHVSRFAARFAEAHHSKYAVCCCNGTIALMIALRAAGVLPGQEVIMPAYTFMATATAAIGIGATPVIVDVDSDTLNLDPTKIEAAVTERTGAIMPVHLAGMPAAMGRILDVAAKHDLPVVEDAAQAHLAEWDGKRVGSLGATGAFSFQSSKNLTGGEGGMVTTSDPGVYQIAHAFHHCGRDPAGGAWYSHPFMGQNFRMTQLQAALLDCQMDRLEQQHQTRMSNGKYLSEKLARIDGIKVTGWPWPGKVTAASYHLFTFSIDPEKFGGVDNKIFCEALRKEGVFCHGGYDKSLQDHGFFDDPFVERMLGPARPDYKNVDTPVSRRTITHCVWLKQNQLMAPPEAMDLIVTAVTKIRDQARHLPELADQMK
ncbi:MAG: DegT/DnrJ/EryC1/StrS family aminotransferase [Planctomycetota bacterium]|jgi:dTDP-4-amino-4,6-dideoxygalactose transaminase